MDEPLKAEFDRIIAAKEERRRMLAALPWPEKVRILVRMQKMIVPIVKDRDPRACVWQIPGWEEDSFQSSPSSSFDTDKNTDIER